MDSQKRFGLSSNEKIKSKLVFQQIFSEGKIIYSSDKKIKALYITEQKNNKPQVIMAVAVSKKIGGAVWRNKAKRLIRESYRLNKIILHEFCEQNNILIKIVFSPNLFNEKNNKTIKLSDIMPYVVDVMLKVKSKI
jgi:ribonuclease P protein component